MSPVQGASLASRGRLRSLGITPLEVHASSDRCEFRIEGRLGNSTLRYMQWAVWVDQERTVIRVSVTQLALRMILEELANSCIQVDHCIRLHAA